MKKPMAMGYRPSTCYLAAAPGVADATPFPHQAISARVGADKRKRPKRRDPWLRFVCTRFHLVDAPDPGTDHPK